MKLRKLHIEDYKMFKDFDISFVDENDKALPIVVLAGVNGSGKTSLLEYLHKPVFYIRYMSSDGTSLEVLYQNKSYMVDKPRIKEKEILAQRLAEDTKSQHTNGVELVVQHTSLSYNIVSSLEEKTNNIIYLDTNQDNISSIKETIIKKYIDRAFELDKPSKAFKELQDYIQDIFHGLDLTFNLFSIDYNNKKVLFNDNDGVEFDISQLSTGEKTLLSKVLYLYFEGYKDKVILIDEPELSLHPSWQNKVLKIYENFAVQNNCQIIIATHSPHIIGSAKNEYLRFLIKEDNKIVVKELTNSPLDRDVNTIVKTLMGADYISSELELLRKEYREFFDNQLEDTQKAKELEQKILNWESPNSSFWQGIAFDKELRDI